MTRRRPARPFLAAALIVVVVPLLAGCASKQNSLAPESKPAREITHLWWNMLIGSALGLGIVALLLFAAWWRRGHAGIPRVGDGERFSMLVVLGLGVGVPIVVLATLFVFANILIIGDTQAPAASKTKLTIQVVARQWFWEIRYPGTTAVTANELHIPVRTPVNLEVTTADVIHSFWVPQLNRKIDTIPGQTNRILLYADKAGRYRGQCAEFCGLQHAHMSMYVFADPPARFRAWLANEAKSAAAPAAQQAGERVFLEGPCANCHAIRGTAAKGYVGPDLTHLGSRTSLGALTLPNDRTRLASWIVDSQHFKPGNQMPNIELTRPQLNAVVDYLESLK
ncbi:MAG: cytochrome c oxidase subunit II [Gaiellaceae bacterium]